MGSTVAEREHSRAIHLAVPFERQAEHWCGPAALASVYAYFGAGGTQEEIAIRNYNGRLRGTLNVLLAIDAAEQGYRSVIRIGDWDLLQRSIRAGVPVIAMLRVFRGYHYVVVTGFDPEKRTVIYHDGRNADRDEAYDRFAKRWRGADNCAIIIWPKEKNLDF